VTATGGSFVDGPGTGRSSPDSVTTPSPDDEPRSGATPRCPQAANKTTSPSTESRADRQKQIPFMFYPPNELSTFTAADLRNAA
jgi:hypothetical protein